eukprot:3938566-Rhodomonas_salina.1
MASGRERLLWRVGEEGRGRRGTMIQGVRGVHGRRRGWGVTGDKGWRGAFLEDEVGYREAQGAYLEGQTAPKLVPVKGLGFNESALQPVASHWGSGCVLSTPCSALVESEVSDRPRRPTASIANPDPPFLYHRESKEFG